MARDLAAHSAPITELFPKAAGPEDWRRFTLGEDRIARFEADGFLTGIPMLDHGQVERLRADLAVLMDPDHDGRDLWYEYDHDASANPGTTLFHAVGAWRVSPAYHDLLWHPAFCVPAAQILGGPVRLLHDQLFCKPAGNGGVVAWHQDYSYWTATQPLAHLSCWIALDDATRENGCLWYVPGSHRWGLLPITGLTGNMEAIRSVLTDAQIDRFRPVPIELKKGEAALHHPLLVHGSFESRSDRPRRGTVINALRDGAQFAVDFPLIDGVPSWLVVPTDATGEFDEQAEPKGSKLGEPFFPLLIDPAGLRS